MNPPPFVVLGIGLATLIGVVFSALAGFHGRGGEEDSSPRWGGALALGVGSIVGHAAIREWLSAARAKEVVETYHAWSREGGSFPFWPGEAVDWLPWLVALATLIGLCDAVRKTASWSRWENRLLLTGLMLGLLLAPLVQGTWETKESARWLVGLGVAMVAFWSVLDARAERLGPAIPIPLTMMAAALAVVLVRSGSMILGLIAGTLAAASGGIGLVALANRRLNLGRAGVPPYSIVYLGLLMVGFFYSEVPKPAAVALVVAPLFTFVDRIGPIAPMGDRKKGLIRAAALLIPLGGAIGVAFWHASGSGPSADGY